MSARSSHLQLREVASGSKVSLLVKELVPFQNTQKHSKTELRSWVPKRPENEICCGGGEGRQQYNVPTIELEQLRP
jgi:hypothetical protein